jgi:Asp-tRNA(Asn)/Glu-tRNA(Gln) amidotransferase A subunit family amidase
MARSVADIALIWTLVEARLRPERAADLARRREAVIAGEWFDGATPPRLAVVEEYHYETSEPFALDAFRSSIGRLEEAGAAIERLALPPSFAGMHPSHRLVMAVEAADVHRADFAARPDTYRPKLTQLIERGLSVSAVDYRAARVHQQRFAAELAAALDAPTGPIIAVSPATVSSAPPLAEDSTGDPQFNSVWSFSGLPTCGVPACLGEDGLPLSLQLGAARESFALFQAAAWCEAVLEFPANG